MIIMVKSMNFIFTLIGAAVLTNGVFLLIFANFTLGNLLTFLLGIFLLFLGLFKEKIRDITKKGVPKVIKYVVLILLLAELLLVSAIALFGGVDNATYKEDAVIVLGAAVRGERVTLPLQYRLDSAVEYHEKNPEAYIIVTGGKGLQEDVTEAYAMEKYLLSKGVSEDKIIKEEKATSTEENMAFSKEIADGIFSDDYSVCVITNDFHILRGVSMAKDAGFSIVTHKGADLQWFNLISCYLRESLAVLKLWIVG